MKRLLTQLTRTAAVIGLLCASAGVARSQDPSSLDGILSRAPSANSVSAYAAAAGDLAGTGASYEEALPKLLAANPNLYVFVLQDLLAREGSSDLRSSGILNQETLNAIGRFCRVSSILDTCRRGVLNDAAALALGRALDASPVAQDLEDLEVAEQQPQVLAAPTETAPEPVVELPAGWRINNTLGGVTPTVVESGPDFAVIRFQGTAGATGYVNVVAGPIQEAASGQAIEGAIRAQVVDGSVENVRLRLRASIREDSRYLGDLHGGVSLDEVGSTLTRFEQQGTVSEDGATQVQTYVQLQAEAGAEIDLTVRLQDPELALAQ